jgi:hypothetical protein
VGVTVVVASEAALREAEVMVSTMTTVREAALWA